MKPIKTPPFVSGALPVVGHAIQFSQNRTELFERGYKEHGDLFAIKLGNQKAAVCVRPDQFATFFTETDKKLNIQKPYNHLQEMFGEAVFLAPHDKYLAQRPMIMELFRRQKMVDYLRIMQEQVQAWLDSLGQEGSVELTGQLNRLVQDVAGHCFLGSEVHERIGREFWDLYEDLNKGIDPLLPPNLPLPRFIARDRARDRMQEILRPIIQERRNNPEAYNDMIQDVLQHANNSDITLSDEDIINLFLALMFAGHETTAGQAAWTLIMLLKHPDYLEKVQQEIESLTTPGEQFDHRAMAKMDHISWAVREVERLYPSADLQIRYADEDVQIGEYVVPKGWLVQTAVDIGHTLPELWDDPEQFDPTRFSPERAEDKQHRFMMIGFGGGMHKCTGMNFANNEMMIIAAMLFQQYEIELLTPETTIRRGLGANRPSETWIRYKKRPFVAPQAQPAVELSPATD